MKFLLKKRIREILKKGKIQKVKNNKKSNEIMTLKMKKLQLLEKKKQFEI